MSEAIKQLLTQGPKGVNIGLKSFAETLVQNGAATIQVDWRPPAKGDAKLAAAVAKLWNVNLKGEYASIDEANKAVVQKMLDAQPTLIDVVPAGSVIPELTDKVLLHAGPPITFNEMTGPGQGACIGAVVFEGWAKDHAEAEEMLRNNEITFIPCHAVKAVGPMGGITSKSMPVLVVKNVTEGNVAYCQMNEGIGKVMRMGANGPEVLNRLAWMRDTLGPWLSKALKVTENGLNLKVIMGRAVTMGDEFHQRNIAGSAIFLREMAGYLAQVGAPADVFKFLADTDQFFLNCAMAASKATADAAATIKAGTIVTAMSRNGVNFGIKVSGCGDVWFQAPVNKPEGLYFSGYTSEDGNPDIGDSAITETIGLGGVIMAAAPGVIRFVGAGGFTDGIKITEEQQEICIATNPHLQIPTLDFSGGPIGIDVRKVVETGITPIINTGIAHKKAGVGQVGAGTVRAPYGCFEKALYALTEVYGV
ncbi:MAG TPA: DUF1116 domain-containing protein [Symbiobacteriaceae bacterium]|nr:DUF1116 domain-containing protein [Symbiobacteriaceae bacterium]